MGRMSNAVDGTNYQATRPFALAFAVAGGTSANTPLAKGAYYLVATGAPCVAVVGLTTGPPVAAAIASTQAATTPTGHFYCPQDAMVPLDVTAGSCSIAALGTTTTAGTLYVIGPIVPVAQG